MLSLFALPSGDRRHEQGPDLVAGPVMTRGRPQTMLVQDTADKVSEQEIVAL
jgi:hypothetical protein